MATGGKAAARRPRLTKEQAALAAARWVNVVQSTLSALIASIDATRDELKASGSPLAGALDPDQLRTL